VEVNYPSLGVQDTTLTTMPKLKIPVANPKPMIDEALEKLHEYCAENNDALILSGTSMILRSELYAEPSPCKHNIRSINQTCKSIACNTRRTIFYNREFFQFNFETWKWERSILNANTLPFNEYITKYNSSAAVCSLKGIGFHCHICMIPLTSELYGKLSPSQRICPNCYTAQFVACKACGKRDNKAKNWQHTPQNGIWCKECFDKVFKLCKTCARAVTEEQLDDDGCDYCQKEAINRWDFKPSPVFITASEPLVKRPGKDPFFGIELEVEMKEDFKELTNRIARRFANDVQGFAYLKADGTITNGFEVVSHPGNYEWWHAKDNPLFKSLRKLSKTCESYWAQNCGLHVHISKDSFKNNFHQAKFISFILDNPLFMAFIAERYQKDQAPISTPMAKDPFGAACGEFNGNRHTAVNIWDHNGHVAPYTIEVRIFKGNMKPSRILKDIEYLQAIFDFTMSEASGGITVNADHRNILESQKALLTVGRFRDFVYASDKYPNLAKFIENYKRAS